MAAKDDLAFIAQRIRKLVDSEPKDAVFLAAVWRLVRKAMELGACAGVQFTEFNKFFDSQRESETYDTRRDVLGRQVVTPAPISRLPLTMLEAMKWLSENGTDIGLSVPSGLPMIGDFESVTAKGGSPSFVFRIKYPSRATLRPHVEFLAALIDAAECQQSTKTPRHSHDDSAFVAAKTLREQRGMTAAKCNKFLSRHGTKSEQPVEGMIRYRKPNTKKLDIHSGDWAKFWQDFDRRQSNALDEDAMQEFLANAEAEKAKVKAKRKLGRASSRQVS